MFESDIIQTIYVMRCLVYQTLTVKSVQNVIQLNLCTGSKVEYDLTFVQCIAQSPDILDILTIYFLQLSIFLTPRVLQIILLTILILLNVNLITDLM
jgi:hypothetical protein